MTGKALVDKSTLIGHPITLLVLITNVKILTLLLMIFVGEPVFILTPKDKRLQLFNFVK